MSRLILFLPLFFLMSCAVINPIDIPSNNKLASLDYELTPRYKLKVALYDVSAAKKQKIMDEIDERFKDFADCYDKDVNSLLDRARSRLHVIVETTFECSFHGGRCNGEVNSKNKLVILAYKAFNRDGIIPLAEHEWGHLFRLYDTDHDNKTKQNKECIKYLKKDDGREEVAWKQ
jgi:hypothetical protein